MVAAFWSTASGRAASPRMTSRSTPGSRTWRRAPSFRKWFGHDPAKWDEFRKRYARELEQRSEALEELLEKARAGRVTLIFSAKDTQHNNAVALREHLERRLRS